jgi:nicotinamide-nucleotide amidase
MIETEIITIGDELLIGQVTDTNSAFMAQELNKAGFEVRWKTTVGDSEQDILNAFAQAFMRAAAVLVTGGLGPTKDDITKNALCKFFKTSLVFDESVLQTVLEVINSNKKNVNDLTRNQAYVPENCTVVQNRVGTAPVMWFERDGKILVSMPGVPYEMKWAMEREILPRMQTFFKNRGTIRHRSFWVKNYTESMLAIYLEKFENELPDAIKLAYLPTSGLIRLRLTEKVGVGCVSDINRQVAKLTSLLAENIVSDSDENLENILDKLLVSKSLTLSVAESCTGGKIASLFTAIPGCSRYFLGGAVTYSNNAKINVLGVNPKDIEQFGAVSRQVVEQMAAGACRVFGADCAIATSGIAGPDGGTAEKPVGTVWIAVKFKDKTISQCFLFSKSRESNILRAANNGIRMLMEEIA